VNEELASQVVQNEALLHQLADDYRQSALNFFQIWAHFREEAQEIVDLIENEYPEYYTEGGDDEGA
jgi:hypothetical protein